MGFESLFQLRGSNADAVVLWLVCAPSSLSQSVFVGYISHCFLVEICGVVFHIRIIQVILTRAEQVVGSF